MRVSQRQSFACIECTRLKIKCDRKVPCSRCTRLQKNCAREVVQVRKEVTGYREETDFLQRLYASIKSERDVSKIETLLQGRFKQLGIEATSSASQSRDDGTAATSSEPAMNEVRTLESHIWLRQSSLCYPHRQQCSCHLQRSYAELASINADVDNLSLQWTSVPLSITCLPSTDLAQDIVSFHIEQLAWHHNVLHCPTFWRHCQVYWQTGMVVHPFWLALYISVINATLWTVTNSDGYHAASHLNAKLLQNGFSTTMIESQHLELNRLLYEYRFLENPSLFCIQSIVIASRYAHNIGFSDSLGHMLYSAGSLAQAMGLHRILPSDLDSSATIAINTPRLFEKIEREVGKRIWWQLVVQDHFSIPFTETYALNTSHCSTAVPLNCDDDDLVAQAEGVFTSSSYTRSIAQEALLVPKLFDGLGPIDNRVSPGQTYKQVLQIDSEMRNIVNNIAYLLGASERGQGRFNWLPTARHTLAISAADKIIMIHRPMLRFAFKHAEFDQCRKTCVAAAVAIFREYELVSADNSDTLSIWTQSAFCTTATVVLGLELLFRPNEDDVARRSYRELMRTAATKLKQRRLDNMAVKCASTIDALLEAEKNLATDDSLDNAAREEAVATIFRDQLARSSWSTGVYPQSSTLFSDEVLSESFTEWYESLFGTLS